VELELEANPGEVLDPAELRWLAERLAPHVRIVGNAGAPSARYEPAEGVYVEVPAGAFSQVNWEVNRALVSAVVTGAAARQCRSFCDLYGGVGNFALPLVKAGGQGTLVERDRRAARAAERAAVAQGLALQVLTLDVPLGLARLRRAGARPELVVLDPPRSGAKHALDGIVALGPAAIAYVACDPVTLARDVRSLVDRGFVLESVQCFDMFPQTHHVEVLAWLGRAA
jgi:23S rRNA (uracil1939-C5)-methyltransferase